MTRLQYLKCRNRKRVPFGELPEAVKDLFRKYPTTANEFCRGCWYSILQVSGGPGNGQYSEDRIFRVTEDLRPPGIPEQLHRRYT